MPDNRAPTDFDVELGGTLAELRRQRGLSQADLADVASVSHQQIQKYEKGTNRISAARLYQIAKLLGFPISAFFPDDVR